MIASLRGILSSKGPGRVVVEAGGVGYEVHVTVSTIERLPDPGAEAALQIAESYALYGGGTTLYGFLTSAEKEMFVVFKDSVPNAGAKKALEYLEKASKSPAEFRRALLEKDGRLLEAAFGFTRKTADKLIAALKDKWQDLPASDKPEGGAARGGGKSRGGVVEALSALESLGYKTTQARADLDAAIESSPGKSGTVEELVREALKRIKQGVKP